VTHGIGTHLIGMHLIGMRLIGMNLIDMHPIAIYVMIMCLAGAQPIFYGALLETHPTF
jgi:hypothetical protein